MLRAGALVPLLVLGSAWILQSASLLPEPPIATPQSFDLDRFMGKWLEVAFVSTCPLYMQRRRGNPAVVALELQRVAPEAKFTATATSYRNGSCVQKSTDYGLTDTPGRFFHHVARFNADVDSFVVQIGYDEYAMMLQLSTESPSGNETTIVKLYSRTSNVTAALLDSFKALVRQHGMSDDAIVMNQSKGECVPGEPLVPPQPQRSERNVVKPVVPAQEEDTALPG